MKVSEAIERLEKQLEMLSKMVKHWDKLSEDQKIRIKRILDRQDEVITQLEKITE